MTLKGRGTGDGRRERKHRKKGVCLSGGFGSDVNYQGKDLVKTSVRGRQSGPSIEKANRAGEN